MQINLKSTGTSVKNVTAEIVIARFETESKLGKENRKFLFACLVWGQKIDLEKLTIAVKAGVIHRARAHELKHLVSILENGNRIFKDAEKSASYGKEDFKTVASLPNNLTALGKINAAIYESDGKELKNEAVKDTQSDDDSQPATVSETDKVVTETTIVSPASVLADVLEVLTIMKPDQRDKWVAEIMEMSQSLNECEAVAKTG